MTLPDIRFAKSFEDLKPAIRYLCDNMQVMPYGEFHAYKRTLEYQCTCLEVPASLAELNEYALQYQQAKA